LSRFAFLLLGAISPWSGSPAADELEAPGAYDWSLRGGVEYFRWQELDQSGSQLVQEKGPRLVLTGAYDNLSGADSGLLLGLEGRVYGGEVDYDGETIETAQRVNSQTRYFGGRLEGLTGSRIPRLFGEHIDLDLTASLGLEHWLRSILDSKLDDGTRVMGYDEYYTVVYGKLGLGPVWRRTRGGSIRLNGGMKYPLYTHEVVDTSSIGFQEDAKLEPEGRISGYIGVSADLRRRTHGTLFMNASYEGYRFGDSDPDTIRRNDGVLVSVFQPRIRSDVFSLELGWRF
jgi:hypothetical protein